MTAVPPVRRGPRIAFYLPVNLNVIDGSSIWVATVAATLVVDPGARVILPLRGAEHRDLITGGLRALGGVELLPPPASVGETGFATNAQVLDMLEALDREEPFDVILLRSFALCREAVERPWLRDRLWSTYILEPERDTADPAYLADMARITNLSRYVVCQSEEMRSLFESLVPEAVGRTILLPPSIPGETAVARPDPAVPVNRMLYTGKFSPFYPVGLMIDFLLRLRAEIPDLEFHVAGDKMGADPANPSYAADLRRALTTTRGVVWHGGMSRAAVEELLAAGGVALSLWDHRHGSEMNDLVISTKLLDYCSVGLPVILNRTAAQEEMLGADYPLFVARPDEALPLLRRVLRDPALYEAAARRTLEGARRFTCDAVHARLRPYLDPTTPAEVIADAQLDRPKLPGSAYNVAWVGGLSDAGSLSGAVDLVRRLREADSRYRLLVKPAGASAPAGDPSRLAGALAAAVADSGVAVEVEVDRDGETTIPWWLRKVGWLMVGPGGGSALLRAPAASRTPRLRLPGDPAGSGIELAGTPAELATRVREIELRGGPRTLVGDAA